MLLNDLPNFLQHWYLQIFAGLVPIYLLFVFYRRYEIYRFPVINGPKPFEFSQKRQKREYTIRGRQMLREGLKKFGGKPFNMMTDHGYELVFGPQYIDELRNLEDVSHARAIAKMVNAHYPGLEAFYEFGYGEGIVQDAVKLKLTQALGGVTQPLSDETALTLQESFTDNKEWHSINPQQVLLNGVARVSSRLFLGDKLCRDPAWLKITTTYTTYVAATVFQLNSYPAIFRRIVAPYLTKVQALTQQVSDARGLIGKVLKDRASLKARGEKPEYVDAIEWCQDVAQGRHYDPVYAQLTLSFVAIHTTADMITQLMFDLAQFPEYIQPLREEVIAVLGKDGWKKTSLYNMKLLDSAMKESQRLRPINDTALRRIVIKKIKLSDGTILRPGQVFAASSTQHWDPEIYPDADKFVADRFLKMRAQPGKENVGQFVTTSPNHLGFGHGDHACPGRFFASNEIKIIMCHILLKYDWKLPAGQTPKPFVHGWHLAADHKTNLEIRRREAEIDVDNLF
ncbi:putative cytochrome P450 [Lophium mytilinum]|uniref:Putative cytochrome P450 n=1 Tax=Lophium mytilinum TaxID=390894 RepID=A0A6A6R9B8_9PEZI|nr:putative cytochrome P450 [Lophium mytilinum]